MKVAADVLGVKPNPAKIPEAAPLPKVETPSKFIMPPDGVITHEANIITVEGRIGKTRQNTKGYKRLTRMRARNYRGTNRHKNNYEDRLYSAENICFSLGDGRELTVSMSVPDDVRTKKNWTDYIVGATINTPGIGVERIRNASKDAELKKVVSANIEKPQTLHLSAPLQNNDVDVWGLSDSFSSAYFKSFASKKSGIVHAHGALFKVVKDGVDRGLGVKLWGPPSAKSDLEVIHLVRPAEHLS